MLEILTKGTGDETFLGVTDGKRGLSGQNKAQKMRRAGGIKAHRLPTHYHARACQLHLYFSLCQFSSVPKRKKAKPFCMSGISPADITEKIILSL